MKTKVIFRIHRGEVIALFPELPGNNDPRTCLSYVQQGQHGAAPADLGRFLRLASPEESAPLKRELEAIGYELEPVRRSCPAYYHRRRAALNL